MPDMIEALGTTFVWMPSSRARKTRSVWVVALGGGGLVSFLFWEFESMGEESTANCELQELGCCLPEGIAHD